MARLRVRESSRLIAPLILGAALLALWHCLVIWTKTSVFPSPGMVVLALFELQRRGVLMPYLLASLWRTLAGFLSAAALGVSLGLWMGQSSRVRRVLGPVLQLLRPISPLAWIPLSIVFFGIGSNAAVFLIFLSSLFPIAFSTENAVRSVPEIYLQAAANLGLSRLAMLHRVLLPAAFPQILGGLRIALGISWMVVVAAEMIAIDSGLGYLILDSRNAGKRYDLVIAGMVLIGATGLLLDTLMRRIETMRWVRWGFQS